MNLQKEISNQHSRIQDKNERQLMDVNLNSRLGMSHDYMSICKNKSVTVDDKSGTVGHRRWWSP